MLEVEANTRNSLISDDEPPMCLINPLQRFQFRSIQLCSCTWGYYVIALIKVRCFSHLWFWRRNIIWKINAWLNRHDSRCSCRSVDHFSVRKKNSWMIDCKKLKKKKKFKSHAAVSCDIVHLLTTKPLHAFVSVRNIKYSWTDTSSLVPIAMEQIT